MSAPTIAAAETRVAARSLLIRSSRERRRELTDRVMRFLALAAAVACVIPLIAMIGFVTVNGITAVNIDLFTKPAKALGIGGGAAAANLGTIQMVGVATLIAVPMGVVGGFYLNEFASRRSARWVRFAADVLTGVPSILIGIFAFTVLVVPMKHYNAIAGSLALAVIMIPIIMRTTEEILRMIPGTLREAGLALGVPVWRVLLQVVLPTGLAGILTGVMLAVARAAGETAPLLFTALGSRLINVGDFNQPMDALPLFIYANARQPYDELNHQAWGAAFLLLVFVLVVNILVRYRTWGRKAG
jgi:phosphate transport system permease protein